MMPRDRKHRMAGICDSAWCRNKPAPEHRHCHKCRKRKYKHAHTLKYAYQLLRSGARRRGIVFTLSYAQYEALWQAHPDRLATKLRNILRANCPQGRSNSMTWEVDRIDPRKGYEDGNLQLLRKKSNVAKGNKERWVFMGSTERVEVKRNGYVCPF